MPAFKEALGNSDSNLISCTSEDQKWDAQRFSKIYRTDSLPYRDWLENGTKWGTSGRHFGAPPPSQSAAGISYRSLQFSKTQALEYLRTHDPATCLAGGKNKLQELCTLLNFDKLRYQPKQSDSWFTSMKNKINPFYLKQDYLTHCDAITTTDPSLPGMHIQKCITPKAGQSNLTNLWMIVDDATGAPVGHLSSTELSLSYKFQDKGIREYEGGWKFETVTSDGYKTFHVDLTKLGYSPKAQGCDAFITDPVAALKKAKGADAQASKWKPQDGAMTSGENAHRIGQAANEGLAVGSANVANQVKGVWNGAVFMKSLAMNTPMKDPTNPDKMVGTRDFTIAMLKEFSSKAGVAYNEAFWQCYHASCPKFDTDPDSCNTAFVFTQATTCSYGLMATQYGPKVRDALVNAIKPCFVGDAEQMSKCFAQAGVMVGSLAVSMGVTGALSKGATALNATVKGTGALANTTRAAITTAKVGTTLASDMLINQTPFSPEDLSKMGIKAAIESAQKSVLKIATDDGRQQLITSLRILAKHDLKRTMLSGAYVARDIRQIRQTTVASIQILKDMGASRTPDQNRQLKELQALLTKLPEDDAKIAEASPMSAPIRDASPPPASRPSPAVISEPNPSKYPVQDMGPGMAVLDDVGKVKRFTPEEQAAAQLTIRDGKFYDVAGKPFDTSGGIELKGTTNEHQSGKAIYVMDADGKLYAATDYGTRTGGVAHSTLSGGKPVASAGEIEVRDGKLLSISNESGHYRMSPQEWSVVLDRFEKDGVNVAQLRDELKKLPADARIAELKLTPKTVTPLGEPPGKFVTVGEAKAVTSDEKPLMLDTNHADYKGPTVDHHGKFREADRPFNNTTKQVLNRVEEIGRDTSLSEVQKADLLKKEFGTVTTDNIGDGMMAIYVARNSEKIMKDPELRSVIKSANFYEDFAMFGTKYQEIAQKSARFKKGVETDQALLDLYDEVGKKYGLKGSDRFDSLPAEKQKALVEDVQSGIGKVLNDPTEAARRRANFLAGQERAVASIKSNALIGESSPIAQLAAQKAGSGPIHDALQKIQFVESDKIPASNGVFTNWSGVPMTHDKSLQMSVFTDANTGKTGFILAVPHGRTDPKLGIDISNAIRTENERIMKEFPERLKAAQAKAAAAGMDPAKVTGGFVGSRGSDLNFSFDGVLLTKDEVLATTAKVLAEQKTAALIPLYEAKPGLTNRAYEAADHLRTLPPEQHQAVRDVLDRKISASKADYEKAKASKDFDKMGSHAYEGQYYREMSEAFDRRGSAAASIAARDAEITKLIPTYEATPGLTERAYDAAEKLRALPQDQHQAVRNLLESKRQDVLTRLEAAKNAKDFDAMMSLPFESQYYREMAEAFDRRGSAVNGLKIREGTKAAGASAKPSNLPNEINSLTQNTSWKNYLPPDVMKTDEIRLNQFKKMGGRIEYVEGGSEYAIDTVSGYPIIRLNKGLKENPAEMGAILTHELDHYARHDRWVAKIASDSNDAASRAAARLRAPNPGDVGTIAHLEDKATEIENKVRQSYDPGTPGYIAAQKSQAVANEIYGSQENLRRMMIGARPELNATARSAQMSATMDDIVAKVFAKRPAEKLNPTQLEKVFNDNFGYLAQKSDSTKLLSDRGLTDSDMNELKTLFFKRAQYRAPTHLDGDARKAIVKLEPNTLSAPRNPAAIQSAMARPNDGFNATDRWGNATRTEISQSIASERKFATGRVDPEDVQTLKDLAGTIATNPNQSLLATTKSRVEGITQEIDNYRTSLSSFEARSSSMRADIKATKGNLVTLQPPSSIKDSLRLKDGMAEVGVDMVGQSNPWILRVEEAGSGVVTVRRSDWAPGEVLQIKDSGTAAKIEAWSSRAFANRDAVLKGASPYPPEAFAQSLVSFLKNDVDYKLRDLLETSLKEMKSTDPMIGHKTRIKELVKQLSSSSDIQVRSELSAEINKLAADLDAFSSSRPK